MNKSNDAGVRDTRDARISAALAHIKQDYYAAGATPRHYVENAVAQLVDAGYSQAALQSQRPELSGNPGGLQSQQPQGDALAQFTEYFVKNYPPDTYIEDPKWHAPRVFRAAKLALQAQPAAQPAIDFEDMYHKCKREKDAAYAAWERGEKFPGKVYPAAQPSKAIPMEAIGRILAEAMETAVKNGANSVSMPDEYVAIAHFLSYSSEYQAAQPSAPQVAQEVALLSEDESAVHIYPSDLGKMECNEMTATVYSVAMGCPDEKTVPLFTLKQVHAALSRVPAAPAIPAEQIRNDALEEAALVCDDLHYNWRWDDEPDSDSGPRSCARKIRAMTGASPRAHPLPAEANSANLDFYRGVIAALGALAPHCRHGDTKHDEIVRSVNKESLYAAAEPEDVEWAGLDPVFYAAIHALKSAAPTKEST